MRLMSPYRKQNAKVLRLLAKKIIITYENELNGLSYFPNLNAIIQKCFICNCFHSKDNLCDLYFVLLLVSFVKFSNNKIHPHIDFSVAPNNTCPRLDVEKCTPGVYQKRFIIALNNSQQCTQARPYIPLSDLTSSALYRDSGDSRPKMYTAPLYSLTVTLPVTWSWLFWIQERVNSHSGLNQNPVEYLI